MVEPKKGAGFGLYKPRPNPKTLLVYQVNARVLLRCLKQIPLFVYRGYLFLYCIYISLLDYFLVYFPLFGVSLVLLDFFCVHL